MIIYFYDIYNKKVFVNILKEEINEYFTYCQEKSSNSKLMSEKLVVKLCISTSVNLSDEIKLNLSL